MHHLLHMCFPRSLPRTGGGGSGLGDDQPLVHSFVRTSVRSLIRPRARAEVLISHSHTLSPQPLPGLGVQQSCLCFFFFSRVAGPEA